MKTLPLLFAAIALLVATRAETRQQKVVRVKPGFATVIVCPAVPELVTVGNSQQFVVQSSGNYVLVKPVVNSGSTNLFIKAGMDSYNLVLQVSATPDLEIKLLSKAPSRPLPAAPTAADAKRDGEAALNHVDLTSKNGTALKGKEFETISPKVRPIVSSYLKTPRRYTYSVKNSDVVLALDHMVQIEDKLYMICTIVNSSKIPYDIGFVHFKLVDYDRSLLLFRKKVKEITIEPISDFYSPSIKPETTGRMLFVFNKQGFSDKSMIEIKCDEESGRRDLTLNVPGSYVE